jgi:hypothetical protein
MRSRRVHSSGWESYELCWVDAEGRINDPVTAALKAGEKAETALSKIELVEAMGWPEARKLRFTTGNNQKKRIVQKDDHIWELKCTPACWRLYFYVQETDDGTIQRFVYVHAVCKHTGPENPADAITARQRYDRRRTGGCLAKIPDNG